MAAPLAALVLGIAASSCADLSAIRQFASISSDAVRYQTLVKDYVAAPRRMSQYRPTTAPEDQAREQARKDQEPALLLQQAVLQDYMDVLGKLAANETVSYSKDFSQLGQKVSDAKFASKEDAEAAAKLGNLIAKAATDAWRQKRLKELIGDANAPVQQLIGGLQLIVRGFLIENGNEALAAKSYYQTLIRSSSDKAGIAALEEWEAVRVSDIGEREKAITTYGDVLKEISAGHQELYDNRDRLCNEDTLRQIRSYADELKTAYRALQDLRG